VARRLALPAVIAAVLLPVAPALAQDDSCPPNSVTGAPTQSTIHVDPVPPGQPGRIGIVVDPDDGYFQKGSLVLTITGPDGTHEYPSPDNGIWYTAAAEGDYSASARYQVLACTDPVRYANGSAGPLAFHVQKPAARKKVLPEDSSASFFTVTLAEASRVARKLGFLYPHRLPSGNPRHFSVVRSRRLTGGPPGTPQPSGLNFSFDGGTSHSAMPQVYVFALRSVAYIRHVVLAHDNGYKRFGGSVRVSKFSAGRFSGSLITVGTGVGGNGYVEYIWHAKGGTYLMTLPADNGRPRVRGVTARQIVASFA